MSGSLGGLSGFAASFFIPSSMPLSAFDLGSTRINSRIWVSSTWNQVRNKFGEWGRGWGALWVGCFWDIVVIKYIVPMALNSLCGWWMLSKIASLWDSDGHRVFCLAEVISQEIQMVFWYYLCLKCFSQEIQMVFWYYLGLKCFSQEIQVALGYYLLSEMLSLTIEMVLGYCFIWDGLPRDSGSLWLLFLSEVLSSGDSSCFWVIVVIKYILSMALNPLCGWWMLSKISSIWDSDCLWVLFYIWNIVPRGFGWLWAIVCYLKRCFSGSGADWG